MALPPLSVVVPTRDTCALTLRCLAAVFRELPDAAEVVVADDGSRDGTAAAVAARFPAAQVVTLPAARGFSAAVNAGAAVATGAVLLFLNSDAEVQPGALAALVAPFAARPRLGAAGARLFAPDGTPQWSGGRAPDGPWLFAVASGLGALAGRRRRRQVAGHGAGAIAWLPGTALAVRAAAWRALGPFDEALGLYAQDLDLCLRLGDAGWEVAVVADARVVHVGGATVAARAGATAAGADPAELWTGLARVVAKRRGTRAGRRAARLLRLGAALRIVARTAATPCVPAARRAAWRRDTRRYRAARTALAALV